MSTQQQTPQLAEENHRFAGTGGVSEANAHAYFVPAFQDIRTGHIELSRFQDGRLAPCHLLDGLPEEWIIQRDMKGRAIKIRNEVISGFIRLGQFFTRMEAASFMEQLSVETI